MPKKENYKILFRPEKRVDVEQWKNEEYAKMSLDEKMQILKELAWPGYCKDVEERFGIKIAKKEYSPSKPDKKEG